MSWFSSHGVELKIEDDGRAFPVSNSSSSVIDCLMSETKKNVTAVSVLSDGKFLLEIKQLPSGSAEHVEVDYLLIATGSNRQGYQLASQLGHSIVEPMPSLFTFKIEDLRLKELSGLKSLCSTDKLRVLCNEWLTVYLPEVTFPKVKVRLKLDNLQRNVPQLTQVGPMLVTHWGLSGPAILRLSAWGARYLFSSGYKGKLVVDFIPDVHVESLKTMLSRHKLQFA
ncbi:FAD/NAD(P)-binding oxidoreductase family protein, partial [Trifolium pratense]